MVAPWADPQLRITLQSADDQQIRTLDQPLIVIIIIIHYLSIFCLFFCFLFFCSKSECFSWHLKCTWWFWLIYIRSLRVFFHFKVYIHEVYLNCIVCIFNRIDLYKLYIIYIWLWKRIPYIYNPNVQKKCLILHYFLTSDDTSFFLTKLLIKRN